VADVAAVVPPQELLEAVAVRIYGDLRTPSSREAGAALVRRFVVATLLELGEVRATEWGVVHQPTGTVFGGSGGRLTEAYARDLAGDNVDALRCRVRVSYPDRVTEWFRP
jgi:hypothetical protein